PDFGAQPRFAQVERVLFDQARGVSVDERQRRNLRVGRRPAQANDVREEQRVLGNPRREEQVRRRQGVGGIGGLDVAAGLRRELRRHGGVNANGYPVGRGLLDRSVDLLADGLTSIGALAPIRHFFLGAWNRFVGLLTSEGV